MLITYHIHFLAMRFTPPPETPYNSPTAWGTHETKRKEKAAALRAKRDAIRARDRSP